MDRNTELAPHRGLLSAPQVLHNGASRCTRALGMPKEQMRSSMLATGMRRALFCAVLAFIITNVFGHLRYLGGLADAQEYYPGLSLADPWQKREYLVWPLLSLVLALAAWFLQYIWERVSLGNAKFNVGNMLLIAVACFGLSAAAAVPSFMLTYAPNIWDNFDPALKWFPTLANGGALLATNVLTVVLARADRKA